MKYSARPSETSWAVRKYRVYVAWKKFFGAGMQAQREAGLMSALFSIGVITTCDLNHKSAAL